MITVQDHQERQSQQSVQEFARASAINQLHVEVITEARQFDAIAPAWDRLVEQAGIDHPFLSHVWLSTWWKCFGARKEMYIILVKSGKELIAAAPMMIQQTRMYGLPVRRLESTYNFHTPRYDFLVKERSDEVYRAIWGAMSAAQGQWDVIVLEQVPSDSPTVSIFDNLAQTEGWFTGRWTPTASPFIRLEPDYDAWYKRIKGTERYKLRRRLALLRELGPVDVEVITAPSEVSEAMEDGIRLEAAAWKREAGTAIDSDPNVREFYMRLAERAADLGLLKLTFLRVGAKRIAFDYVLAYKSALYGIKIGYDPSYHTYSPGHQLLTLSLKQAFTEGFTEYDFLGGNDAWKLIWTRQARAHQWLFMFRNAIWPRMLHGMKFSAVPWLCGFTRELQRRGRIMMYRHMLIITLPCFM